MTCMIESQNEMKKIESKKIKEIEVNILKEYDRFCKSNNLKYYLSGGTLLGGIRHKGFIPWDDDIDVCMPRKDYEFLVKNFKNNNNNLIIKSSLLNNLDIPFAKIVDINTEIDSKFDESEINKHLWIDIFPVDGLPDDIDKVKEIYSKCNFYRTLLLLQDAKLGEGTTFFRKYAKYILKPLAKFYGKKRCAEKLEKIAKSNPYETSKYVGAVTWGLYGAGERMLKSEFEKVVEVEFEGHKFPAFFCWDSYLRGLYGNYMELPPVEKRKTHNMTVYLKED